VRDDFDVVNYSGLLICNSFFVDITVSPFRFFSVEPFRQTTVQRTCVRMIVNSGQQKGQNTANCMDGTLLVWRRVLMGNPSKIPVDCENEIKELEELVLNVSTLT
jgi:hypothetical protein